jgi:hypothetical protein
LAAIWPDLGTVIVRHGHCRNPVQAIRCAGEDWHAESDRRAKAAGELTDSLDTTPTEAVLEEIGKRDHFAAIASLRPILAPSSVAVVARRGHPGQRGRRGPSEDHRRRFSTV